MDPNENPKRTIVKEQSEILKLIPSGPAQLPDFIQVMKAMAQKENAEIQMIWQDGKTIKVAPDSDPHRVYQEWAQSIKE